MISQTSIAGGEQVIDTEFKATNTESLRTLPKVTQEVEQIVSQNNSNVQRLSWDSTGESTYFGMDKTSGNLSIGGHSTNIPFESFQSSMGAGNMANEFAAAVSGSNMKSVLVL